MSAPRPHLPNPEITQVRNIVPKTRGERGQTRDELEKARLRARTGGFERYVDPAEVLTQPPDSLGYADDTDRFNRDTVGMERSQREAAYAHKEMILYARRSERAEREEERWQQVELEHAQDEAALAQMREDGSKWRRNKSSAPYHLLSMQYADDRDGEQLRLRDDQAKYRASHRAATLASKDNNTGYNPITGEPRSAVQTLERPSRENYGL